MFDELYDHSPDLEAEEAPWTVGRLIEELQAERAANAALLAVLFKMCAELNRQQPCS